MFTQYGIAFAPARKSYWIGLLFAHKNDDFGAISLTEWGFAAPNPKMERHVSDRFCFTLWCSRTVAEVNKQEGGLESTETEENIQEWGLGLSQTLSVNCYGAMSNVCERLIPVLCRCYSY